MSMENRIIGEKSYKKWMLFACLRYSFILFEQNFRPSHIGKTNRPLYVLGGKTFDPSRNFCWITKVGLYSYIQLHLHRIALT